MLHSRVARSNMLRLHAHGRARHRVRAADPDPARGRDASAARSRYDLDRLGEADVVYALRMQNERMGDAFVPSLREYVACYQIDSRRLQPRQLLMHPGPVNRGVELSAEVIESPQALIVDQVAAGSWCGWRSSTSCSPGSDRERRARSARPSPTVEQPA